MAQAGYTHRIRPFTLPADPRRSTTCFRLLAAWFHLARRKH